MAENTTVDVEDLYPVKSRVSWGAIMGGAVVALSLYFLLTILGGAVGMSISDKTTAKTLGIAAASWAILITAICLFFGGLVAANLTTGENKYEAALYGILVWATVFAAIVWLMATGVKTGFAAMIGVANTGTNVAQVTPPVDWEAAARTAGFSQAQLDELKARGQTAPAAARAAAEDPANKEKLAAAAKEAADAATKVAWWTFLGVWLAMAAAALGGYVGAGPTFRLVGVQRVRVV